MISHRLDQIGEIGGEDLSEVIGVKQTNNTYKLVLKTLIAKEKGTVDLAHHFAGRGHGVEVGIKVEIL